MTNTEAITKLTNIMHDDHYSWHPSILEAFRMAVDALKGAKGDCISRQAAIDALHMHLMYRLGTDSNKKRLDDWINGVPSVQETHEERTETHACDLISRQAAIENSFEVYTKEYGWCEVVGVDAISELPSAQPEQPILCGECKHYKQDSEGNPYCYKNRGYGWYWDDYCSYAERREG